MSLVGQGRHVGALSTLGVIHFCFAGVFATSRAQSMKSCATGLSVRVFRVTTPFGTRAIGRRTGKTLISERMAGKFKAEGGRIVTKRAPRNRLTLRWGG